MPTPAASPITRWFTTLRTTLGLDWFITAILAAVALAVVLPARGTTEHALQWTTTIGIGVLFFLYGARLSPRETLDGLRHWRLQLTVVAFTFVLFPALGLFAQAALTTTLGAGLAAGMLYLTLVPSTVQSSITFVSIARGNLSGAVVAASMSNLLGVFATPLLVALLMTSTSGLTINGSSILAISVQLLLPFVLGQLTRRWVYPLIQAAGPKLGLFDKVIIVVIVYTAFSEAIVGGMADNVSVAQLAWLLCACIVLLAVVLCASWAIARLAGFTPADQRVIQFCGSKKSLATGLPMAAVLFVGQPLGELVLPLMVFHQIQLIVCAWLASRYGARHAQGESTG